MKYENANGDNESPKVVNTSFGRIDIEYANTDNESVKVKIYLFSQWDKIVWNMC